MANTDRLLNADPYAAGTQHPTHAAAPDQAYPYAATEATETHRRGPERPQTRSEYIDQVLAQIKAPAK